ncbi:hypothetical protein ABVT39_011586 [Epinephelus coioides]
MRLAERLEVRGQTALQYTVCEQLYAFIRYYHYYSFLKASVFLLRLKETSRRKRFAPLQGLECGEEIIRTLREIRPLFAGVCDSTHQRSIN